MSYFSVPVFLVYCLLGIPRGWWILVVMAVAGCKVFGIAMNTTFCNFHTTTLNRSISNNNNNNHDVPPPKKIITHPLYTIDTVSEFWMIRWAGQKMAHMFLRFLVSFFFSKLKKIFINFGISLFCFKIVTLLWLFLFSQTFFCCWYISHCVLFIIINCVSTLRM